MPELPEVETIRRQLAPVLTGRRIEAGWGLDSPKFSAVPEAGGLSITDMRRRGKYLLVDLNGSDLKGSDLHRPDRGHVSTPDVSGGRELVIHLGMTGRLSLVEEPPPRVSDSLHLPRHLRAWWALDDGCHLGFWDQRRFGRIAVVEPGCHGELPTLAALGPEPFSEDFDAASLRAGLSGRKAIKTALLDQRLVAGVGNIYADEALWLAGISPTRRRLGIDRAAKLRDSIVEVLEAGLADGGTTLRDYRDAAGDQGRHQERLRCYGRAGRPCDRCGEALSRRFVDARGTTWCRNCQT